MLKGDYVGGYWVRNKRSKEELLNLLIKVMSSRGLVVEYRFLKKLTCEELIKKLENLRDNWNVIVTEYDLEHNMRRVYKGRFINNQVLKLPGRTIFIEDFAGFKKDIAERIAGGNAITEREKILLHEIERREAQHEQIGN